MMLSGATDKFQLVTSSAATIDVVANSILASSSTGAFSSALPENTPISSATTTDIVAAAGGSTIKRVKFFTARNKDASLSCDVTVLYKPSGTALEIHKVTLAPGDCLQFIEGIGFFTLTSTAKLNKLLRVSSDVVQALTSFADITGLTIALKSGKTYAFEAHIFSTNNAATTGSQFGYNIGAAPTVSLISSIQVGTSSTTAAVMVAGSATARDTAASASTLGTTSAKTDLLSGYVQPSADGTFALRVASEVAVAAGVTVKAGSWMMIRETDN